MGFQMILLAASPTARGLLGLCFAALTLAVSKAYAAQVAVVARTNSAVRGRRFGNSSDPFLYDQLLGLIIVNYGGFTIIACERYKTDG